MLRRTSFTFLDEDVIIGSKDNFFFRGPTHGFADQSPCVGLSLTSRLKIALAPLFNLLTIESSEALLTLANGIITLHT